MLENVHDFDLILLDITKSSNFGHIKGRRNFIQLVEGDICHYDIIKGKTFEGTSKHREDILVIKKERELMIFKVIICKTR